MLILSPIQLIDNYYIILRLYNLADNSKYPYLPTSKKNSHENVIKLDGVQL